MRFTGILPPEEFRIVTRAHVIEWRKDLEHPGSEAIPVDRPDLEDIILEQPPDGALDLQL
jgi:hypothetical protein